jgi:3-deoxy-D-manno-octulosonate 8-phosphate phosphatase (KDO 8-P phosphatase)
MHLPPIPHPAEALVLAKISQAVLDRVRPLRLMAFDVDGVLTDGRLWYGENGEQLKSFHVLDGHGLKLLREGGVMVALITGRESTILARRAAELGIALLQQGVRDKAQAMVQLAQDQGVSMEQTGYMGDDIIDLAALQKVGFAATVPDAPAYIGQVAHWMSSRAGGTGAVRECCDLILAAQGKLGAFLSPGARAMTGAIQ